MGKSLFIRRSYLTPVAERELHDNEVYSFLMLTTRPLNEFSWTL
jgi:hypothetical protein